MTADPGAPPGPWSRLIGGGLGLLLFAVAAMWFVEIVDTLVLGSALERRGIRPRTVDGLVGILWAPFLHGTFTHLVSNTLPLLILGGLVLLGGVRQWATVTLFIVVFGGLATWLFARSAVHIGASMVVFGYIAYLIVSGFTRRSAGAVLIALAVGVLYGTTLLFGILPTGGGVSWEGHLFGGAAGVVAAFASAPSKERAATG